MAFTKIIKYVDDNICNRLFQGNGVITRVLAYAKSLQYESDRGLISGIVYSFTPWIILSGIVYSFTPWIIYKELVAWQ